MESKQRAWESLRNDARNIDSLIEHQLTALENTARIGDSSNGFGFGSSSSSSSSGGNTIHNTLQTNVSSSSGHSAGDGLAKLEQTQQDFDRQRAELEAALLRFESIVDAMAEVARGLPPASAAHTHTDRFQRLVAEKRRAVQRVVADFRRRREWAELMPAVAGTLAGAGGGGAGGSHDGVRLLVEEQSALRHTQRRVQQILQQAEESREGLRGQRERFMRMEDRVLQIAERVPVIKSVLGRIDSRRRREAVVLGAIVGICLFITVFFI
ncbi:golgi SNARE protein-like [Trypanosoma theileri]|uniref:Golgi SNARE protein-like n=1 Tax=Trypanosoma theileri TaxID=67003 RepID=A0A1X0P3F0_9TRYP|nr:golgi SNARE protein-like [Trypanosoma theileri]ORC91381.1 golgi SNARE protein-like [Trypanosoma theileri]